MAGMKLAPLLTEIKVNIDGFKSEMEKAKTIGVTEAEHISEKMSGITKAGDKLVGIGQTMTAGITLPIVGAGAAVTKMAVDYESSFAKVSTLLDQNVVDFGSYKEELLDASSESKIAVGDFSEAVYNSISAGVDQTKAIGFTTEAMKLAKGGFTDGAKAVDILTTAINAYGLETEDVTKVSDMLITTQNLGKTTVDELASSMGKVIPTANAYNVNLANVSTALADLTKNGIATAEATTYYNGMLNELGKTGTVADKALRELSGKGFAQLMEEGVPLTEVLQMLEDSAEASGKTLGDMFGSSEAAKAALVIMKDGGVEYNEILQAMESSAGATQAAFEKIDSTPMEKMNGAMNELKNAGIKLGIALVPVFEKAADLIGNIADKFSGLSDEQKDSIIKWGGILAAAGPVLTLLGGGIKTVTGVASAVGGLSAAMGGTGLAASLGAAAVAAAPVALGVAAIGTAGYAVYKCLNEEVVPAVDLFADEVTYASDSVTADMKGMTEGVQVEVVKISEATQTAVQAYMDMDDELSRSLYEQKVTNATVTSEIATDTIGQFKRMADTVLAGEEESYQKRLTEYQQFFTDNGVLTDTEEQLILGTIGLKHQEREQTINESMGRVSEIYNTAYREHRELTEEERTEINQIQMGMRDDAITAFSETEAEAAVIRERMKEYQGRLSVEMASELVTKAIEARDGEILAATEKCDEVIRQAARMLEAGDITEEQYERIVKDAETSRDDTIRAAEEACGGIITKMKESDPDIMTQVNTTTGAIKTAWDNVKTHLSEIWTWIKDTATEAKRMADDIASRDEMTGEKKSKSGGGSSSSSHYNGLDYVPYDGYQARLHMGERVLTRTENEQYSNRNNVNNPTVLRAVVNIAGTKVEDVVIPMVDDGIGAGGLKKRRGA